MIFNTKGKEIGIYGIFIDNKLVYIGQSKQLSTRAQTHERGIRGNHYHNSNWYSIAHQFYLHGHDITFRVLEEVESNSLIETEERYINNLQPIFNTKKNGKYEKIPTDYEKVVSLLKINTKPYVGLDNMICRDRAEQMGWFGENYPNTEEFYWWEHK